MPEYEVCHICCDPLLDDLVCYPSCGHLIHATCHEETVQHLSHGVELYCFCTREVAVDPVNVTPIKIDLLNQLKLAGRLLNDTIVHEIKSSNVEYINPRVLANMRMWTSLNPTAQSVGEIAINQPGSILIIASKPLTITSRILTADGPSSPHAFCRACDTTIQSPQTLSPLNSHLTPTLPPIRIPNHAVVATISTDTTIYDLPFQLDEVWTEQSALNAALLSALLIAKKQLSMGVEPNSISGIPKNLDHETSSGEESAMKAIYKFNIQRIVQQTLLIEKMFTKTRSLVNHLFFTRLRLSNQLKILITLISLQLLPTGYRCESPILDNYKEFNLLCKGLAHKNPTHEQIDENLSLHTTTLLPSTTGNTIAPLISISTPNPHHMDISTTNNPRCRAHRQSNQSHLDINFYNDDNTGEFYQRIFKGVTKENEPKRTMYPVQYSLSHIQTPSSTPFHPIFPYNPKFGLYNDDDFINFTPTQTSSLKHPIFQQRDAFLSQSHGLIGLSALDLLISTPSWNILIEHNLEGNDLSEQKQKDRVNIDLPEFQYTKQQNRTHQRNPLGHQDENKIFLQVGLGAESDLSPHHSSYNPSITRQQKTFHREDNNIAHISTQHQDNVKLFGFQAFVSLHSPSHLLPKVSNNNSKIRHTHLHMPIGHKINHSQIEELKYTPKLRSSLNPTMGHSGSEKGSNPFIFSIGANSDQIFAVTTPLDKSKCENVMVYEDGTNNTQSLQSFASLFNPRVHPVNGVTIYNQDTDNQDNNPTTIQYTPTDYEQLELQFKKKFFRLPTPSESLSIKQKIQNLEHLTRKNQWKFQKQKEQLAQNLVLKKARKMMRNAVKRTNPVPNDIQNIYDRPRITFNMGVSLSETHDNDRVEDYGHNDVEHYSEKPLTNESNTLSLHHPPLPCHNYQNKDGNWEHDYLSLKGCIVDSNNVNDINEGSNTIKPTPHHPHSKSKKHPYILDNSTKCVRRNDIGINNRIDGIVFDIVDKYSQKLTFLNQDDMSHSQPAHHSNENVVSSDQKIVTFDYSRYNHYNHWPLLSQLPQPIQPVRYFTHTGQMIMDYNTNRDPITPFPRPTPWLLWQYSTQYQNTLDLETPIDFNLIQRDPNNDRYNSNPNIYEHNSPAHKAHGNQYWGKILYKHDPLHASFQDTVFFLSYQFSLLSLLGSGIIQTGVLPDDRHAAQWHRMSVQKGNEKLHYARVPSLYCSLPTNIRELIYTNNNAVKMWKMSLDVNDLSELINHIKCSITDEHFFIHQTRKKLLTWYLEPPPQDLKHLIHPHLAHIRHHDDNDIDNDDYADKSDRFISNHQILEQMTDKVQHRMESEEFYSQLGQFRANYDISSTLVKRKGPNQVMHHIKHLSTTTSTQSCDISQIPSYKDVVSSYGFCIGGCGFDTLDWVHTLHLFFQNFSPQQVYETHTTNRQIQSLLGPFDQDNIFLDKQQQRPSKTRASFNATPLSQLDDEVKTSHMRLNVHSSPFSHKRAKVGLKRNNLFEIYALRGSKKGQKSLNTHPHDAALYSAYHASLPYPITVSFPCLFSQTNRDYSATCSANGDNNIGSYTKIDQYIFLNTHYSFSRGFPHFHRRVDTSTISFDGFEHIMNHPLSKLPWDSAVCTCIDFQSCQCGISSSFSGLLSRWATCLIKNIMVQSVSFSRSIVDRIPDFIDRYTLYDQNVDYKNKHNKDDDNGCDGDGDGDNNNNIDTNDIGDEEVSLQSLLSSQTTTTQKTVGEITLHQLKAISLDNEIIMRLLPTHSHLALTLFSLGFGCLLSHPTFHQVVLDCCDQENGIGDEMKSSDILMFETDDKDNPQNTSAEQSSIPRFNLLNLPINFLYQNINKPYLLDLVAVLKLACFVCLTPNFTEHVAHAIILALSLPERFVLYNRHYQIVSQYRLTRSKLLLEQSQNESDHNDTCDNHDDGGQLFPQQLSSASTSLHKHLAELENCRNKLYSYRFFLPPNVRDLNLYSHYLQINDDSNHNTKVIPPHEKWQQLVMPAKCGTTVKVESGDELSAASSLKPHYPTPYCRGVRMNEDDRMVLEEVKKYNLFNFEFFTQHFDSLETLLRKTTTKFSPDHVAVHHHTLLLGSLYHDNMKRHEENVDCDDPDHVLLQRYKDSLTHNSSTSQSLLQYHELDQCNSIVGLNPCMHIYDDSCYILPPFLHSQYIPLDHYSSIQEHNQMMLQQRSHNLRLKQQSGLQRWLMGIREMKESEPIGKKREEVENREEINHTATHHPEPKLDSGDFNYSPSKFHDDSAEHTLNPKEKLFPQENHPHKFNDTKVINSASPFPLKRSLIQLTADNVLVPTQEHFTSKWLRTTQNLSQRASLEFQLDHRIQVSIQVPVFDPTVIKAIYHLISIQPRSTQLINTIDNITKTYESDTLGQSQRVKINKKMQSGDESKTNGDRETANNIITHTRRETNSFHRFNILSLVNLGTPTTTKDLMFAALGQTTTLLSTAISTSTLEAIISWFSVSFVTYRELYRTSIQFILYPFTLLTSSDCRRYEFYNARLEGPSSPPHYQTFNDDLIVFARLMKEAIRDRVYGGDRTRLLKKRGTISAPSRNPFLKKQPNLPHYKTIRNKGLGQDDIDIDEFDLEDFVSELSTFRPSLQTNNILHVESSMGQAKCNPNSHSDSNSRDGFGALTNVTLPNDTTLELMFEKHLTSLRGKITEMREGIGIGKRKDMLSSLQQVVPIMMQLVQRGDNIVTTANIKWFVQENQGSVITTNGYQHGTAMARYVTATAPVPDIIDQEEVKDANTSNEKKRVEDPHHLGSIQQSIGFLNEIELDMALATQLEFRLVAKLEDRKLRGERAPRTKEKRTRKYYHTSTG